MATIIFMSSTCQSQYFTKDYSYIKKYDGDTLSNNSLFNRNTVKKISRINFQTRELKRILTYDFVPLHLLASFHPTILIMLTNNFKNYFNACQICSGEFRY